jgi:hypothetical protein
MKHIPKLLLVAVCSLFPSCQTPLGEALSDPDSDASFFASAVVDTGLEFALDKNPKFAPHASTISGLVATRDLKPDDLDASVAAYLETVDDVEERKSVARVTRIITRNYRRVYDRFKVDVDPSVYQEELVEQLSASAEPAVVSSK